MSRCRVFHDELTQLVSQKGGAEKFRKFDSVLMSVGPIQLRYVQDGDSSNYTGNSFQQVFF